MKILTIFAGRENNLNILVRYLRRALDRRIIDQVHFWNYTRKTEDEDYLYKISNPTRLFSLHQYRQIFPFIIDNSFEMNIQSFTRADLFIKINGHEMRLLKTRDTFRLKLSLKNEILQVYVDNNIVLSQLIPTQTIERVEIKGKGVFDYLPSQNSGFYLMNVESKRFWHEYYSYYANSVNDIIIKCDDDIVFIDLNKLPLFFDEIQNTHYDILFANTINNGVSAYFQQETFNLFPKNFNLEYPEGGYRGSLWESGKKGEQLHDYFLNHLDTFLSYDFPKEIIPIETRYSINFFVMLGKNWHKIKHVHARSDEHVITIDLVRENILKNGLFPHLLVSHLSFYKQVETHIDTDGLLQKYTLLADRCLNE